MENSNSKYGPAGGAYAKFVKPQRKLTLLLTVGPDGALEIRSEATAMTAAAFELLREPMRSISAGIVEAIAEGRGYQFAAQLLDSVDRRALASIGFSSLALAMPLETK